jgi:phosphoserine phosphatase RsbU/P
MLFPIPGAEEMSEKDGSLSSGQLWKILELTRRLGTPVDLDDMLGMVIEVTREVVRAERATVFLYDGQTDELVSRVGTGISALELRLPAGSGIAGLCAASRMAVTVPEAYADARFNPEIDSRLGFRTRDILAVPLIGLDDSLVGVLQILNSIHGQFSSEDERIADVLAAQCATALQRARLLEEYLLKQKLERDLTLARAIQREMLPASMPVVEGYELAGWNEPADQTGGDIFDAVTVDGGKVFLLLADACGHGIGPALSVTQLRSMIRMALRLGRSLEDLLCQSNDQLVEDLAGEHFITAFMGLLDAPSNTLFYHACGQGPLLHVAGRGGPVSRLDASTIPMGIIPGMSPSAPEPIVMEPGDIICLVSDGVFEQEGPGGRRFGLRRIESILTRGKRLPLEELITLLRDGVRDYACELPQADDMTIVLLRRKE